MRTVLDGDVMAKWPAGGMFTTTDRDAEQTRFNNREIVHTGPIFGRKTFQPTSDAAERESAILAAANLTIENFSGFGKLVQGTRRHNLIYVDDLSVDWEIIGLRLTFSLPAGSYATVLLREIMKTRIQIGDERPENNDG